MGSRANDKRSPSEAPLAALGALPVRRNETAKAQGAQDLADEGQRIYQSSFFFCTIKAVGQIPGTGPIFVEIAVDRDSGAGFAKVYSTRDPMNGVDLLESRVFPFFQAAGQQIGKIHTARTTEYAGTLPKHTFELFLSVWHIRHIVIDAQSDPYFYLCEQFYVFLLREFFQPELRKTFYLSIEELQYNLDKFIRAYNAGKFRHESLASAVQLPPAKFRC